MKTLYLFRHAKSSWKNESLADHDRPLNKRGQNDAQSMGRLMKKLGIVPDLILCSSAVRARETVRLATENCDYTGEIQIRDDLYAFKPDPFLDALAQLDDRFSSVMLVGHNPAMEELVAGLTGDFHPLPTAALVRINLPVEHWKMASFGIHANLEGIWRPKEI
jgi:phosphohistidine phosphatase